MASTVDAPTQAQPLTAPAPPSLSPDPKLVTKLVLLAVRQGLALLTVDVAAALFRRRSMSASVGRRLRTTLADLGPMYDKLAQLLLSHAALAPTALLAGYESASPPRHKPAPTADIQRIVDAELGAGRVGSLSPAPFRVTALAQLHRATLPDGTEVAVKVRRPSVEESAEAQRLAIFAMATLAQRMLPAGVSFDRVALMTAIGGAWRRQFDFRNEAADLRRMAEVLAEHGVGGVVIPTPLEGLASERVLVTTYLDGTPIDEVTDPGVVGDLTGRVAAVLFAGASHAGFFNADLRPSNVLARDDGTVAVVGFEDCCTLTAEEAAGLGALFAAVVDGDPAGQLAALDRIGALGPDVDRARLLARLTWLRDLKGGPWGRDPLHGVPHLFRSLEDFELTVPVSVLRLAEGVMHLEAVCRRRGADADLVERLSYPTPAAVVASLPAITPEDVAAAAIVREPWSSPKLRSLTRMIPDVMKPKRSNLKAMLPLLVFIPVNLVFGVRRAIAVLLTHQVGEVVVRRIRGEAPKKSTRWIIGSALVFGGIGIVTGSAVVVFLPGLVIPFFINLVVFGSLVVSRPIFAVVAQRVWPQAAMVRRDPRLRRRVWLLSVVFAVFHALPWLASIWVLLTMSVNTYIVVHQVIQNLVLPGLLVCLVILRRGMRRVPEIEAGLLAAA